MPEEIERIDEPVVEEPIPTMERAPEVPTGDAEKGAVIGGVGGLVAGAIAGAAVGPVGSVIGAVVGGVVGAAASGVAVAAVDRIDDDSNISGLPDDMSLEEHAPDRVPVMIDTSTPPEASEAPAEAPVKASEVLEKASTDDEKSSFAYADEPEEDQR